MIFHRTPMRTQVLCSSSNKGTSPVPHIIEMHNCFVHTLGLLCRFGSVLCLVACMVAATAQTSSIPQKTAINSHPSGQQTHSASWLQLTPRQKQALAPLRVQWGTLTAQQQSKWLAISQNFFQLSAVEQSTMHARMADWVALSPEQRNVARFNFNSLQNLPKEDKKAKWEAYQALSADEKSQLSTASTSPGKSAARTAKPPEPHRVVQTRIKPMDSSRTANSTNIDRKTLLPLPPALITPPQAPAPTSSETPLDSVSPHTETSPS
ncbi:hypothetical protein H663_012065 [Limnohabitans planktonicus II-D5]|uniref:DUF3106 domain-containing protein n=2 Tax=Limnohabitans planktonicus TaxID=540060 RepID=A0A2T7UCV4_9BURK|nr:hypothetical protein H663_012065 [Limnohabitans planktonicus II-D5]